MEKLTPLLPEVPPSCKRGRLRVDNERVLVYCRASFFCCARTSGGKRPLRSWQTRQQV